MGVAPRQNGKNGIVVVRELAGLILFGERLQTHTAHRFDTSIEHFRWMRDLFTNWDDLRRRVKQIYEGNVNVAIELLTGQRLIFKARAKEGGRGFAGDLVVFDEAFWIHVLGSLVPSLSAQPNPQIWFRSSAPLPRVESDRLRRLIRRGRALARGERKAASFAYSEYSVAGRLGEVDLDDRRLWRQANPSLGVVRANGTGLREEFIADVERGDGDGALDDEEFARERLGIFDDGDEVTSKIDKDHWKACLDSDHLAVERWMRDPISLGVHVARERRAATIAAAGACVSGGVAVEVVDHRPGALWVPDRLVELVESHHPRGVIVDLRFFDTEVLDRLDDAGLTVTGVHLDDHIRACAGIFDAIGQRGDLWHRGQPILDAAVAKAATREIGNAWLWDTRDDNPSLVAVTLARWGHIQPPDKVDRPPLLR